MLDDVAPKGDAPTGRVSAAGSGAGLVILTSGYLVGIPVKSVTRSGREPGRLSEQRDARLIMSPG